MATWGRQSNGSGCVGYWKNIFKNHMKCPNKTMSYVFRGNTVFEYEPNAVNRRNGAVRQHTIKNIDVAAFDFCCFIPEDYKLLSEFFDKVYRHTQGEDVELKDIEVY
jgi:hypothetical protein